MVLENCFTDEFISSRAGNNIDKKESIWKSCLCILFIRKNSRS